MDMQFLAAMALFNAGLNASITIAGHDAHDNDAAPAA